MIRANAVQVDKLFRARCHLCDWIGNEHETFQDANSERHDHLNEHAAKEAEQ